MDGFEERLKSEEQRNLAKVIKCFAFKLPHFLEILEMINSGKAKLTISKLIIFIGPGTGPKSLLILGIMMRTMVVIMIRGNALQKKP